jgi:hypothetical protein
MPVNHFLHDGQPDSGTTAKGIPAMQPVENPKYRRVMPLRNANAVIPDIKR